MRGSYNDISLLIRIINSPGHRPSGVLDNELWVVGCWLLPPIVPQRSPGAQEVPPCLSLEDGNGLRDKFFGHSKNHQKIDPSIFKFFCVFL